MNKPTIALLPWGNLLEDFIDNLGVSLETFCTEFTGSWLFGYIDALETAGVSTVLVCVSARVKEPTYFNHRPTGAKVCVLPTARVYRLLQKIMLNPYGRNVWEVFGKPHGKRLLFLPAFALLAKIVLYLPTPPVLLARELRQQHCAAILCQEYEYPRFDISVLVGRLTRIPVFASFQGGDYQRSHLESLTRPLAIRFSSGLIIPATNEINRVKTKYSSKLPKIARIFNPVNLDLWQAVGRNEARHKLEIPLEARVAVWHGRVWIGKKGLDVLLDAWEIICREHPGKDMRLLLVGTGQDAEEIARQIKIRQLPGVMIFNKFYNDRQELVSFLSAADVYVFPSRHEGFAVALIEAMACSLPVVAADASGVLDILAGDEKSGGLIVPRGDAVALASALDRVLGDKELGLQLGEQARRRVEEYCSFEAVGKALRSFILGEI